MTENSGFKFTSPTSPHPHPHQETTLELAQLQYLIVDALEDVKAQDIEIFDVSPITSLFDRVVIASGTSNRQTRALAKSVHDKVKENGGEVYGMEGEETGEWVLVDCGDVVVHIQQPTIREYYRLADIWGEKEIALKDVTDPFRKKKAPAKAAAKSPAKAPTKAPSKAPAKAAAKKPAAKPAAKPTAKPAVKKAAAKAPSKSLAKPPAKAPTKAAAKAGTKSAAAPMAAAKKPAAKKPGIRPDAPKRPTTARAAAKAASKPVAKKPAARKPKA